MGKHIQAVRGMNDILPSNSKYWATIEELLRHIATQYGYQEIRLPLLEFTGLFVRTIGTATDIVEKEMYTFLDRNNESLTLRPEGTAGCIRAGIEHSLFYNKVQRLFYCGPMFRHERPQKGRYRQFHQFGVEAYGLSGPDIDVEMMLLARRFWQAFKIEDKVQLHINTLGSSSTRAQYRDHLIEYFQRHYALLDEDSKRRLTSNPLRILDSKNPALQELIKGAPKILEHLDQESWQHFTGLCKLLDHLQIPYVVNPNLVRGLDYYCLTVFEWVIEAAGAQNALCAGGHYDNLVAEMGGKPTPAIGFALGLERLYSLVVDHLQLPPAEVIYLILLGEQALATGMLLAEKIRNSSYIPVIVNCGDGNLSAQLKRADKSEATMAWILGAEELATQEILIKYLRTNKPQHRINIADTENFLLSTQG